MKPTFRRKHLTAADLAIVAGALALSVAVANAKDIKVTLSGDQEVPPVSTTATGTGNISVGDDMSISGSVTTSGIAGTMAHIHMAAPGKNGPVVVHMTKTSEGVWTIPAGTKLTKDQFKDYEAGDLYINVHSDAHDKGELRGQIKP